MLPDKLDNIQQLLTILSMLQKSSLQASFFLDLISCRGNVPLSIANLFLTSPITLSMWILTLEFSLDFSISLAENWDCPLIKAGVRSSAPHSPPKSSCRVNPRSAKIWSPGIWICWLMKPESLTILLSLARPPHPCDRNVIVPRGLLEMRYLTVLCFL